MMSSILSSSFEVNSSRIYRLLRTSMDTDHQTKVILLPENIHNFSIIDLPFEDGKSRKIVISKSGPTQAFELRQINGNNTYIKDPRRPVIPATGCAVKSFIFENPEQGQIISSPNLIVSNKFNLTYWLINITYKHRGKFVNRIITYEDLADQLSSLVGSTLFQNLEPLIKPRLEEIFEIITEGGELFYKLSLNKIFQKLNDKINKLFGLLKRSDHFSLTIKIKQELYQDVNNTAIPPKILDLSILRHAIDLVFASYLSTELKQDFIKAHKVCFDELEKYIRDLQETKKSMEVIAANMSSVVQSSAKANGNNRNSASVKKKTTKKEVKKVAVGKGALDGFFKKA